KPGPFSWSHGEAVPPGRFAAAPFRARAIIVFSFSKDQCRGMKTPSRLHADLAHRILVRLAAENAAPGHHLVELELCATFGVSRTPVRGALKLLEQQGVVKAREGRGYILTKLPPQTAETESEAGEDSRLFHTLAEARSLGALPDQ